jgi:uncharacterized membrane protein YkvA (DUF1232 family)
MPRATPSISSTPWMRSDDSGATVRAMDWLVGIGGVVAALVVVWLLAILLIWWHRPSRDAALEAIRLVPDILALGARLAADRDTPRSAKVALAVLVIWLASPIDLIPEFVPVLGPLDDIVVAAIVLRWVGRRVGVDRLRAGWRGTDASFERVLRLIGATPSS